MREAPVEFLPTYKKADGRPPLDTSDPDWPLKEYQVQMKKGVLGQRKTVERPPSVSAVYVHLNKTPCRSPFSLSFFISTELQQLQKLGEPAVEYLSLLHAFCSSCSGAIESFTGQCRQ